MSDLARHLERHASSDRVHSVWKSVAMFLSGAVLSLASMWATYVRNAVSRDEMERYVNQREVAVEQRLDELNKNVIELKEVTARIDERTAGRDAAKKGGAR
ncbi:MAG TPA: hypothetical protein VFB23_12500 [Candidatus Acidoferrales bacterium]|jgi:CHASE1-domain containing sensor protein|nr:hypothetical protein [Candidatus Acidoferrales bacterium]